MIPSQITNPIRSASHITHPTHQRPLRNGTSEPELAWNARRSGQFKNAHDIPAYSNYVPVGPGLPHGLPLVHQNGWEGPYAFRQAPGYLPLQSIQPVVAPMQWNSMQSLNGADIGRFHHPQAQYQPPQQAQYHGPVQYHEPPHFQGPTQYNGQPQYWSQPQHHGQFHHHGRGQNQFCGQGRFPDRQPLHRESWPPVAAPVPQVVLPETPTPQISCPNSEQWNKENPIRPVHSWKNVSDCPQSSGEYVPPPLPPVDLDLVAEVGDTVRIKPWADQFTWIEGRVEKADFSVIKNHKPSPRYIVSYRDPVSKNLKQRAFCPHLNEIMVREPDEPGTQPLPKGINRNIYACVPPPTTSEAPIEMIWAHARVLVRICTHSLFRFCRLFPQDPSQQKQRDQHPRPRWSL
ncbi:hypothetical protein FB451DRAFT_1287106 [Mycena latifolia]|nr:hypothetical protein FB451DRAFT_1287106 [Mycena latifolia]